MNKTYFSSNRNGTFLRVFGLWFAYNPFGNCFSPAVCINKSKGLPWVGKPWVSKIDGVKHYPSRMTLTLRWGGAETMCYWRGGLRFDWNSEHVARRFGKEIDADHGTRYQYNGILGYHVLV